MSLQKSDIDYIVGKEYPFTVKTIHNDFCELKDDSNFSVFLQHTNRLRLVRGQKIVCRVLANTEKRPKIEIVLTDEAEENEKLDANVIDNIIRSFATTWNTRDFSRLLMMSETDMPFEDECRRWIDTLNNAGCDLGQVRKDCTDFLEQSAFLSLCNPAEREFFQDRMTVIIEQMGYSIKANMMLADDSGNDFIDTMFDKLRSSAFVYHPQKNFNIMACLFLADRQLMEARMEKLFDIIRLWKVEIWGKEPFNSTLTKIIGMYVNENIDSVDRVKDNRTLVGNLIQALAIELLLMKTANRQDDQEYRLCLTRLCIMASYIFDFSTKQLLGLSMYNLLGMNTMVPSFTLEETKEKTVPLRICGMTAKPMETTSIFIHGKGKLVISDKGIVLYAGQEDGSKPVMAGSLHLWGNMQVMADKRSVRALPAKANIIDCMHLWEDVEQELFASKTAEVVKEKSRKKHKVDDKVDIIITRQDKDNPKLFHCRIDDEMGGEGTILIHEIVPYSPEPEIRYFRSDTGKNLVFEAEITDKEDDVFIFSMLGTVKKWAEQYYGDNERFVCEMAADRPLNGKGKIPAISKDGVSILLGGFDEIEETDFKKGDLVIACPMSEASGTFHINAKVMEHFHGPRFYVSSAFHKLMQDFAYDDSDAAISVEDADLMRSDRILDASHVREIIRMIDRMSAIDTEYVNAYNYLGFARTLCLMAGWDEQATYYRGRMELIVMLHDFAINDMVNQQKLENMERVNADIFKNDASLHSKFLQLLTVSYMGKPEHDGDLWDLFSSQEGLIKDVASLVIAFNMVSRNNMTGLCTDLQNRIKQTLRLKGYESNLKMYGNGVEDTITEYKSSIVFPPNENMRPNIQKQTKNILKVIASFLNTHGGTLYIGTNDLGVGVGLENDLENPLFRGDKDKYQRYVSDAVIKEWGTAVATYVEMSFDHTNEQKDVLIVKVRPYPMGVAFGDKWLVRINSTKREMTESEYTSYRNGSRLEGMPHPFVESGLAEMVSQQSTPVLGSDITGKLQDRKTQASPLQLSDEIIKTSTIRRNSLEEYEEDYRPHIACLKFLDRAKFCKVTCYDYDPCLLTLAVYDEEARGSLILGYADGKVAKVPVEKLLKYDDYKIYSRSDKAKLIFASIADSDDILLTVSRENKSKERLMVRMDSLSELEDGNLNNTGERFFKEGIGEVVEYEIVPRDQAGETEVLMNKDERTLGMPLATLSNGLKEQLLLWGIHS